MERGSTNPSLIVPTAAATTGSSSSSSSNSNGLLADRLKKWLKWDPSDSSRKQVRLMSEDPSQRDRLEEILCNKLEFGTAGLRGKMGPGFNRMNPLVVQQTAQGLYRYLAKTLRDPSSSTPPQQRRRPLEERGIVIGHDARHGSRLFAHVTAAVFASRGVEVYLFEDLVPTPFVAAGVKLMGAAAGVMVTASHNPKEYNGYKVYWGNGCQIIPPHDQGIAAAIEQELPPWDLLTMLQHQEQGWQDGSGGGGGEEEDGNDSEGGKGDGGKGGGGEGNEDPAPPPPVIFRPPGAGTGAVDWEKAISELVVGGEAKHRLVADPMPFVSREYYKRIAKLSYRSKEANAAAQPVVYTPLHGVGAPYVRRAFETMGLPPPLVVSEQENPDPEFPTVAFPNPEEGKGTWARAFATGEASVSRLLLANDPDADRLAVAERRSLASSPPPVEGAPGATSSSSPSASTAAAAAAGGGGGGGGGGEGGDPSLWRTFSGNEIGILLADWLLRCHRWREGRGKEAGGRKLAVLSSAVSSRMLRALAEAEGLIWEETLTGFKWLGNRALELESATNDKGKGEKKEEGEDRGSRGDGVGGGAEVLFAFEEAIGFMIGGMDIVKDKDGVAAAVVFAEMAADLYAKGETVASHLVSLYSKYGHFIYRASYFVVDQPEKSRAVFDRLCAEYPKAIGGVPVESVRDLGSGVDTAKPDGRATLFWRQGDMMVTFRLQGGATLTLRASGTEPKLKYYLEVAGPDPSDSARLADRLERAVAKEVVRAEEMGLKRPSSD